MITLEVKAELKDIANNVAYEHFKQWADTVLPAGYSAIISVPALVGESFHTFEIDALEKEINILKASATEEWQKGMVGDFEWAIARARKFNCGINFT